jgi:hypothetical protein
MALPVAPLGSFSGINLPNYVPTTVVPDRNPLHAAVLAFLQGAAQSGGGKLMDNALSRDYATQSGQTPATFGQKLMQGPTVSKDVYQQQTQNASAMDRLKAELQGHSAETDKTIQAANDRTDKEILAINTRLDKQLGQDKSQFDAKLGQQQTEFKTSTAQTDKRIGQQDTALAQEHDMNAARMKEIDGRLAQMVTENKLSADRAAAISAEAEKTKQETRGLKSTNDFMDKQRAAKPTGKNPLEGAKMPNSLPTAEQVMGQTATSAAIPTAEQYKARTDASNAKDVSQFFQAMGISPPPAQSPVPQSADVVTPQAAPQAVQPTATTTYDPAHATYGGDIMSLLEKLLQSSGTPPAYRGQSAKFQ